MDARHLDTFHAVLTHGTLLATARELGCAQSTLTVRIQELERELGVRLFQRRGRRLTITEAGKAIAERTVQIADAIAALKEVAANFNGGNAGRVRMAAIEPTASHRLPSVIAALRKRRPLVHLGLEVGGTDRVAALVAEDHTDFAIASPPPSELPLEFEFLFQEPLALLAPAGHRLASQRRVTAEDLAACGVLLTDASCAYRGLIEGTLRGLGLQIHHDMEIGSLEALRRTVSRGVGVAIVPVCGSTPPISGTILRRIHGVSLGLPIGVVTRRGMPPRSPAVQEVIAMVRRKLRRRVDAVRRVNT